MVVVVDVATVVERGDLVQGAEAAAETVEAVVEMVEVAVAVQVEVVKVMEVAVALEACLVALKVVIM